MPERKSYAKEIKPGGPVSGGGKNVPVDHGPRATGATPAGAGKRGFAKWGDSPVSGAPSGRGKKKRFSSY